MKNLVKHLTFVQAVLVLFVLVGCSSINTTQKTGVGDAVAEVISGGEIAGDDNIDVTPSSVLTGRSTGRLSDRSSSIWLSRVTVQDLVAQGVWDRAIQGDDRFDMKSTRKSQFGQGVKRRPDGPKVASRRSHTVSVSDALNEVLGGSNTPVSSTVRNAPTEITTATEMDDSKDEESLPK